MRRQQNGRKRIVSNTTPTSAPTGQNANQRVAPLLAAIDLRDYFAAKAMEVDYTLAKNFTDPDWRYGIALDAYKMADAMLKARETA